MEKAKIQLRCHLEISITDDSGMLTAELYSPYAEALMGIPSSTLKSACDNEVSVETDVQKAVANKEVVCFVEYFEKKFRGESVKKYVVIKMVPAAEFLHGLLEGNQVPELDAEENVEDLKMSSKGTELDEGKGDETITAEKQFFSPTTKLVIDEISAVASHGKEEAGQAPGVKRALSFAAPCVVGEGLPVQIPSSPAKPRDMEIAGEASTPGQSPSKKNKTKLKKS